LLVPGTDQPRPKVDDAASSRSWQMMSVIRPPAPLTVTTRLQRGGK